MMQGRDDERGAVDPVREALSALADGEVDAAGARDGVSRWREDEDAKQTWHAYHVIGDVLRSEDLAASRRDHVFMQRLHARLAQEPTVLAPDPHSSETASVPSRVGAAGVLHRWAVPLGVAAGVTLVLGTLLVVRQDPAGESVTLADVQPGLSSQSVGVSVAAGSSAPPLLLRDPRLDRYLAAHKQFQSANAMGPSTGFIRSATYDAATR